MVIDPVWMALKRFGNSGLMLPAAGIVAAWLFVGRTRHAAGWSLALYVLAAGLVGASKIAFYGWGIGIRSIDFAGFSGHAMQAWSAVPVLALLVLFAFGRPLNLDEYIVRLVLVLSGHAQPVAREAWLAGGG